MGDALLGGIVLYGIVLILGILIARAIFSIGTIVKNLQAQTKLLSMMAEKQGINSEEIQRLITGKK